MGTTSPLSMSATEPSRRSTRLQHKGRTLENIGEVSGASSTGKSSPSNLVNDEENENRKSEKQKQRTKFKNIVDSVPSELVVSRKSRTNTRKRPLMARNQNKTTKNPAGKKSKVKVTRVKENKKIRDKLSLDEKEDSLPVSKR